MKKDFKKRELYFILLNDYYEGHGICWRKYNMNSIDIYEMVSFYGEVLNHESFVEIVQYLISDLLIIE